MDEPLVVLSLSGGKDSAAAGLWLRERGIEHVRVFMDTGWEHPDLYEHLDYLEAELGPIVRIMPKIPTLPDDVMDEVLAIEALVGRSPSAWVRLTVYKGMFPSGNIRFCTQNLKVKPFLAWVEEQDQDVISVLGIRADESRARSTLTEREPMPGAEHIEVWRPLLRWTEADVIDIHQRHNLRPCPLYLRGATRVGCWPCFDANKGALALIAKDARMVEAIRLLERLMGRRAIGRGSKAPTMFTGPAVLGPDGMPVRSRWTIDQAIEWAQTSHGGKQMQLGGGWGNEPGCVRWGMCETEPTSGA